MYRVKCSVIGNRPTPASLVIVFPLTVRSSVTPLKSSALRSRAYPSVRLPAVVASRRIVPIGGTVRLNVLADALSTVTDHGASHCSPVRSHLTLLELAKETSALTLAFPVLTPMIDARY